MWLVSFKVLPKLWEFLDPKRRFSTQTLVDLLPMGELLLSSDLLKGGQLKEAPGSGRGLQGGDEVHIGTSLHFYNGIISIPYFRC
jgi:hypothetical protein